MGRVYLTFQHLRPIAAHTHLRRADASLGSRRERGRLKFGHLVYCTHVAPDEAASLTRRICFLLHASCKRAVRWLRGHFQDVSLNVKFPPVIQATQSAFLIPPVEKRSTPVRAKLAQHTSPALRVAENNEILAKQARLNRGPVRLDFLGQASCDPMPPHEPPHRGMTFDTAEQVVLFRSHGGSPFRAALRMRRLALS